MTDHQEYPCRFLTRDHNGCRLKRTLGEFCTNPLVRTCNEYWPVIEGVI